MIPFRTPEEAVEGLTEINRRLAFHAREARAVAAEYFDAAKVLPALLERAMSLGRPW